MPFPVAATAPGALAPHPRPARRPAAGHPRYRARHGHDEHRAPVPAPTPRRAATVAPAGPLARALHHLLRAAARSTAARRAADPGSLGRIRITSATAAAPLVVADDGAGLTGPEVRVLLAASRSGEPLVAAPTDDTTPLSTLVRACLRIAVVVEIRTRSAEHPDASTLKAVIRPDGTVRVSVAGSPLPGPGTEVRLHVGDTYRGRVGADDLPHLVHDLVDQLDVPVEVDGVPATTTGPVWDLDADGRLAWSRARLGVDPLAVLPLGTGRSGTRAVAVVLPEATTAATATVHRVHVDGLRVTDAPADLLPSWASFCRIVLDAGSLPLTADGDALAPGPQLDGVRAELARAVLAQLILLEAYDPERFRRLSAVHEDALVEAALEHRDVMDLVRSTLPVPTSLGPLSLDDFRGVAGVVACAGPDTWPAIGPIAARDGVLVVDARRAGVVRLLETLGTEGPTVAVLRPSDLEAFGIAA